MPTIVEITNPFQPDRDSIVQSVDDGVSIRECVDAKLGVGVEFEFPTICRLNGNAMLRGQWDTKLKEGDICTFERRLEGDPISAIFGWVINNWVLATSIAVAGYSLYVASSIDAPEFDAGQEGDSVFNLSGQRNQTRLGDPIPSPYGKNRLWPSYAASSYTKFENNDQYLFQLFCLGQGTYDVETTQIEDTDIDSYQDITYEYYEDGDDVTLFPDNVVTSSEVGSIVLYGSNETEYAGESGPFAANDSGTTTTILEWDVVFPQGLYYTEDDGELSTLTASATFSYREIDDAGSPVGSWTDVAFSKTLATNTPQRFTVSTTVSAARYEVKAVRSNDADTSTRAQDTMHWFQLRAVLPSTKDYGDVTLLAVKARATNNLNSQSQNRINVICTRKLPIWNGSTWSSPTATRSIVWALADILRSIYGANLADSKIDLATLLSLDSTYTTRGDNFDFVFDTRRTIWEALKLCSRSGRASPVILGTQFSMIRDATQTVPVAAFGPQNMIRGSFSYSLRMQPENDYDGLEVSYIDNETWKLETVTCLVGSDAGTNLRTVTLPGITDRTKAYREGMFVRSQEIFQREIVSFQTGLEGNIPTYGDLCAVSHDAPKWGKTGFVKSIAGDDRTVTLSEPVAEAKGNLIAFRDEDGAIDGPYQCVKTDGNPFEIVTTEDITGDFNFTDTDERPIFFFGEGNQVYREMILTERQSSTEDDTVTLSFVNYDYRIHQFDNRDTTEIDGSVPASPADLPTVSNVTLTENVDTPTQILVSWDEALGALGYIVQRSYDNTVWTTVTTTGSTFYNMTIDPGVVYVRVAGYNNGQGPWASATTTLGFTFRITSGGDSRVTSSGATRITSATT